MENHRDSSLLSEDKSYQQAKSAIYYVLGFVEVLLAFRFLFKLLGANSQSGFVAMIYAVTKALLLPFFGIFGTASASMDGTRAILEPATLVGMAVYAVIAWGIVKLIEVFRVRKLKE